MFFSFFNEIIYFLQWLIYYLAFWSSALKSVTLWLAKIQQVWPVNNTVSIYLISGVLGSTCRISLNAAKLCSFKTWGSFRDYRGECSAHNAKCTNQTEVNPRYETRPLLAIVLLSKSEQFCLWQITVKFFFFLNHNGRERHWINVTVSTGMASFKKKKIKNPYWCR